MPQLASFSSSSYSPDSLLLEGDVISQPVILLAGQNLLRGAVLGKITVGGKYVLSLSASADGSQVPDCILAEDTNATAADVSTIAYLNATVNQNALILGTGQTIALIKEGLRGKDIQLVDVKTTY